MLEGIDWAILLWLLGGVVSGVAELLTGGLVFVPFAVGAFAAAAAAALGAGLPLTVAVFAVVSAATLAWAVQYGRKMRTVPPATREGAHRYIDAEGTVTRVITGRNAGQVRVGGELWRALSASGTSVAVGTAVRVTEVRGNALVVVVDSPQES